MKAITIKTLRDSVWRHVYRYDGLTLSFTTYACDALPGLTVTHEVVKSRLPSGHKLPKSRKRTVYTVRGQRTDSPTQAVRIWNEQARKESLGGGQHVANGAEPSRRPVQ